jgi:hypothetical protein
MLQHTIGTNFITVEMNEPRRATDLSLRVAPNLFTAQTTITIQGPSLGKSQFRLIGNDGKVWMTQQVNENSFVLQNPGLPPGIYYFQVISGAGIGTGKVVVH